MIELTPALTIVIPVYDEACRIESVVDGITATLPALPAGTSIMILNDGSTDWSAALEDRLRARGPVEIHSFHPNRGKGAMLDQAFSLLRAPVAVIIDADGEYAPQDIPAVASPLIEDAADWVGGSRYGFGRQRPPQYRLTYAVNILINTWFRLLSGVRTADLLTGIYGFRTERVRGMRLRERRFAYTAELAWKMLGRGLRRWREVPVSYRYRTYGEGKKIRWWETGTLLLALLRYRRDGTSR